jgi:DnaK suppressor protein
MEPHEKAALRKKIEEKMNAVREDIAAYAELAKPVSPDNAVGRLSRMEAINSRSINEAALRTARSTLARLEHALKQIDDPDFGLCKECEEPIPMARLMILPETGLCVGCAGKLVG